MIANNNLKISTTSGWFLRVLLVALVGAGAVYEEVQEPKEWWQAPSSWFGPMKNPILGEESQFRNVIAFRKISAEILKGSQVFALAGGHHIPVLKPAFACLAKIIKESEK